jgi:hypothetical protein
VGFQGGGLVVIFGIITEVSVILLKTACKCQNSRVKRCYSLFLLDRTPNLSSTIIISIFHRLIKMSAVYVAVTNEQSCILTEIICEFQSLQVSSEDLLKTVACQFSHKSFIQHHM